MFKQIELDHISSHRVDLRDIWDMTVMSETRLIVVSTVYGSLFQLSLQGGRLVKNQIKQPCEHSVGHLLCVQVAGRGIPRSVM